MASGYSNSNIPPLILLILHVLPVPAPPGLSLSTAKQKEIVLDTIGKIYIIYV
jgi:hypothetical protein